jgi:hypothetical protein
MPCGQSFFYGRYGLHLADGNQVHAPLFPLRQPFGFVDFMVKSGKIF